MRSANGTLSRILCYGGFNGHARGRLAMRPMTLSDAGRVHEWLSSEEIFRYVHWRFDSYEETRRNVERWLEDGDSLYLMLLQEGREIGFIHLEAYDPYRRQLWLSLIILDPELLDQGIGTRTLEFLMNRLGTSGLIDRVLLMVGVDNGRAERVYRRVGFNEIDQRQVAFFNGPVVDQRIMECELPPEASWSLKLSTADKPKGSGAGLPMEYADEADD